MRPISLTLSNFMNHKSADISFKGMRSALIVGKTKNNDAVSNGVGKSSIFAAIEWAFFNKIHKTTLDKVIREDAKRCVVELVFEVQGAEYKIHRSLSAKGTKNIYLYEKINSEWEQLSQRSTSETEDKIQEIIKLSHKAFQYSVLFRQADLSGLVEDQGGRETNIKTRTDILKEPLNLSRYSKKEELVKNLIKPIKQNIELKESQVQYLGNPELDIQAAELELKKCLDNIVEKEVTIKNNLQVVLSEKQRNLQELKSTLSASDADVHQKVEDQHIKVKKLNHSIKELGAQHVKSQETIKIQNSLLKQKIDALELLNTAFNKRQAETHRGIDKISNEHKKVCEDELKGSKLLSRAEVELEFCKKSIPDSDNCPSCQQSITADYRKDFEYKANKIITEKQDDIGFYKKQMSKCLSIKSKLAKELDAAKEHSVYIDNTTNQIKSIKDNILIYEEQIINAETSAKSIEGNLDASSKELEESIKHYNDLKELAKKSDLTELNTKIFAIAREIKVYEQSIESMRTEISTLKTREGSLIERIKTRTQDKDKLNALNTELLKLRHNFEIHQHVANSFSHKGIPTQIINTCLNELQFETNKTLQSFRPDLEVEFDADLNFKYRRNGKERDYHQLSYGQHVYIALAFKYGLAKVIQSFVGIQLGLLIFDEIDASLDNAGVQALTEAIKKWQDEFLVLVITHRDSLKDKFSHAILVEEGSDGSETKMVTSW